MANNNWIGNAQAIADVHWVIPSGVAIGSEFTLTINSKSITVVAGDDDLSGTATSVDAYGVCRLLQEAIQMSSIPEWREVSVDLAIAISDVEVKEVSENGNLLILKGPSSGKPITITCNAISNAEPTVSVTEVVKGVAGRNEKQEITFSSTATGGTFTLTYAGETTAAIDYDASVGDVETALEALTAIGSGQVTVTGAAGDWVVEFTGTLAQTNVPKITGDGTNLTGAGQVDINTLVDGSDGSDVYTEIDFTFDMTNSSFPNQTLLKREAPRAIQADSASMSSVGGAGVVPFLYLLSDGTGIASNGNLVDDVDTFGLLPFWSNLSATDTCANVLITNVTNSVYGGSANGPWMVLRFRFPPTFSAATIDLTKIKISHWQEGGYDFVPGWSLYASSEGPGTVITEGGETSDEVQQVTVHKATGGTFTLTFQAQTTAAINYNATAATLATNIQTALEGLSNIAPGDVAVTVSGETSETMIFTVTFGGALAATDLDEMTASAANLTGSLIVVVTEQSMLADVNEIQSINLLYGPTSGTFTVSYGGYTTTALAYNISSADLQTALEALTSIGAGQVSVTGSTPMWTVTFQGTLAATDVALMTGSGYGLTVSGSQAIQVRRDTKRLYTGGTWVQSTRVFTPGGAVNPVNEGIAAGDYAHVSPDNEVGHAAYMARVSAVDSTTVTLSADVIEGAAPTDGTGTRTLVIVNAPTGPNYWDNVDNWSLGALPADTDTITIEHSTVDIMYNLTQSLITPTAVKVPGSFAATAGLGVHDDRGYYEYRPTYLKIGNNADSNPTTYTIGDGDGGGTSRFKLDSGDSQVALKIYNTASPEDRDLPAVIFKGTHASNTLEILKGSVGVAMFAGESAAIASLTIGYISNKENDASVVIGSGCSTITTIVKTGGKLTLNTGATTFTQEAGTTWHAAGAIGTLNLFGGTYVHRNAGNITTLNIYNDAKADFSAGDTAVTITNCTLYGTNPPIDPHKRVTFTNPISVKGTNRVLLDWGTNYNIQRS